MHFFELNPIYFEIQKLIPGLLPTLSSSLGGYHDSVSSVVRAYGAFAAICFLPAIVLGLYIGTQKSKKALWSLAVLALISGVGMTVTAVIDFQDQGFRTFDHIAYWLFGVVMGSVLALLIIIIAVVGKPASR